MPKLVIDQFKGMVPKIDDRMLPVGFSTECENADLERGSLSPVKDVTLITDLGASPVRSFYKQDDNWITWSGVVDVVKGEVADSDHRIFYTGDGYPKQTNATLQATGAFRRLGVIPPTLPLVLVVGGVGSGTIVKTVSYCYTYVTAFGEESYPSEVTAVQEIEEGQYIGVKGFVVPNLTDNYNDITHLRVYRLEADGAGNAEYMMIGTRPVNLNTTEVQEVDASDIIDTETTVWDANAGVDPTGLTESVYETMNWDTWYAPGDDTVNLVQFANGILAASEGNEILVSEPLIPYAYPLVYRSLTQDDIVGLGVFGSDLIAATKGYPYRVAGTDPETMVGEKLQYKQSCLSKRGVLSTDIGVLYPSPDGLFLIDNAQGIVLTKELISKAQWNADFTPASIVSFIYDDDYYGFIEGTNRGFIIDPVTRDTLKWVSLNDRYQIQSALYDPEDDLAYLLVYNTDTETYQVVSMFTNDDYNLEYTWKSNIAEFPTPISMSCGRVFGDLGRGVEVRVYADDALVSTTHVTTDAIFRLKSGFRAKKWQIELKGEGTITMAAIATSTTELL